jgi:hypothetical protein
MIPFEIVIAGDRLLSDWPLEDRERRALVTMLIVMNEVRDYERALLSVIFPAGEPEIYYAKATGNVQLRPRCSLGLDRPRMEVDFLVRATKKGGKIIPGDANAKAKEVKQALHSRAIDRIRYRPMPPKKGGPNCE